MNTTTLSSLLSLSEWAWRYVQQCIACVLLVVLAPLFAVLYVAVRGTSPGPFIFRQERPGYGGRTFTAMKIRTMHQGSEQATALGVTRGAPQITRIGRILRELKLDELPQLVNIARGQMLFVGPRPIPVALDRELREHIPGFAMRYFVRPGLTSVGQVCVDDNGVDEQLINDWSLRFEAECHYLDHKSVRYDIVVIALTILYVFRKAVR